MGINCENVSVMTKFSESKSKIKTNFNKKKAVARTKYIKAYLSTILIALYINKCIYGGDRGVVATMNHDGLI